MGTTSQTVHPGRQGLGQVSPWLGDSRVSQGETEPLQQTLDADVAIIGGGLTGLSTAISLAAEGFDVVVLEAVTAGFGASGRNAGHLTSTIGKDVPTLLTAFGKVRGGALLQLADRAIEHTENLIRTHAIDCDYEAVGNVIAAVHPRQFRRVTRIAEAAAAFGLDYQLLEPQAMRERGLPAAFVRGVLEPHGGILNPGLYVAGLRRAAIEAGVRVFERSPVLDVEEGPRIDLRTPGGSVTARYLVVGTNAYAFGLGLPRVAKAAVMPMYVQLFQTEPLDADRLKALGWQGRQGVYTLHDILESYRLTADNRIVGGSKFVRYGYGGGRLPDRDGTVAARLAGVFGQRFPELEGVSIEHHWGGRIGMRLDFLPLVGRGGRSNNVLYALAYAGHGLALASYAGPMLADLLLGRKGVASVLTDRRQLPMPPEPLRWMSFRVLTSLFEAMDRRVDRGLG